MVKLSLNQQRESLIADKKYWQHQFEKTTSQGKKDKITQTISSIMQRIREIEKERQRQKRIVTTRPLTPEEQKRRESEETIISSLSQLPETSHFRNLIPTLYAGQQLRGTQIERTNIKRQVKQFLKKAGITSDAKIDYEYGITLGDGRVVISSSYAELVHKITELYVSDIKKQIISQSKTHYTTISELPTQAEAYKAAYEEKQKSMPPGFVGPLQVTEKDLEEHIKVDPQMQKIINKYNLNSLFHQSIMEQVRTGKSGPISKKFNDKYLDAWIKDAEAKGYFVAPEKDPKTGKYVYKASSMETAEWNRSEHEARELLEEGNTLGNINASLWAFVSQYGLRSAVSAAYDAIKKQRDSSTRFSTPGERERDMKDEHEKYVQILAEEIYKAKSAKKGGPLSMTAYTFQMPIVQVGMALAGGKAIGAGLGFAKVVYPTAATVIKGGLTGLSIRGLRGEYTSAVEQYEKGGFKSIIPQVAMFATTTLLGYAGFRSGYKYGTAKGYRARMIQSATNTAEKARLETIFKAIDTSSRMPTGKRSVFAIESVENLSTKQQVNLLKFLKSPISDKYKIVQGGSSAQETAMINKTQPHDIDVLIQAKQPTHFNITRTYLRKQFPTLQKYIKEPTNFDKLKAGFIEDLIKTGFTRDEAHNLFDISKYSPGAPYTQIGTGYMGKAVRTPKGSPFKYQMSIQEQAGRKWASALTPLHKYRGKDWTHAMRIAGEKWTGKTKLYETLSKYQPQLEPGTGKLIGPSYYQLHPSEAPTSEFSWFGKIIRKYVGPPKTLLTTEKYKIKLEAVPYGPQLIPAKSVTPHWAKPTYFFSMTVPAPTTKPTYTTAAVVTAGYFGVQSLKTTRYPPIKKESYVYVAPSYAKPYKFKSPDLTVKVPYPYTKKPSYPKYPPTKKYTYAKTKKYHPYAYVHVMYNPFKKVKKTKPYYDEEEEKKKKIKKLKSHEKIKYREREFQISPLFKPFVIK